MSISRLFEIVHILLHKRSVTASELASYFEVSTRTIYRDIEKLNLASIPIYTDRGRGGGIKLLDNFILNKSMFSLKEQNQILSALHSVSFLDKPSDKKLISKLEHFFHQTSPQWVKVDFSEYGQENEKKFETIKSAILNRYILHFDYYNRVMEKISRKVEPIRLLFKAKNWYLEAYCLKKKGGRLFKLSRIKNLCITNEIFDARLYPDEISPKTLARKEPHRVHLKLRVDKSQSYRIFDEFEDNQIKKCKKGYLVNIEYPEDEWLYGYILSFGHYAEVIAPLHIRQIIHKRLQASLKKYRID